MGLWEGKPNLKCIISHHLPSLHGKLAFSYSIPLFPQTLLPSPGNVVWWETAWCDVMWRSATFFSVRFDICNFYSRRSSLPLSTCLTSSFTLSLSRRFSWHCSICRWLLLRFSCCCHWHLHRMWLLCCRSRKVHLNSLIYFDNIRVSLKIWTMGRTQVGLIFVERPEQAYWLHGQLSYRLMLRSPRPVLSIRILHLLRHYSDIT